MSYLLMIIIVAIGTIYFHLLEYVSIFCYFCYFDTVFKFPLSSNMESKIIAQVFVRWRLECLIVVEC